MDGTLRRADGEDGLNSRPFAASVFAVWVFDLPESIHTVTAQLAVKCRRGRRP